MAPFLLAGRLYLGRRHFIQGDRHFILGGRHPEQ